MLRGALSSTVSSLPAMIVGRRIKLLQDLGHGAVLLLHQRQEDVFGVNLGVFVLLQYFIGPHCRFLGLFGKFIESHHCLYLLLVEEPLGFNSVVQSLYDKKRMVDSESPFF